LLIDALHGLAAAAIYRHEKENELRPILLRRYDEIQLQRKINSGLGADFFQQLNCIIFLDYRICRVAPQRQ
jgi:hypothetical protein